MNKKKNEKKQWQLAVDKDTHDLISEIAQKEKRSKGNQAAFAINEWYNKLYKQGE